MENNQSQRFYYPQLDGLRFFAFLLVFIHNAPHIESVFIWKILHEYGWIGVDIFFCLSAYLITKLLVAEYKEFGSINIRNFYIRRILRIFPLYFFYIILVSLYIIKSQNWSLAVVNQLLTLSSFTYNFMYPFLKAHASYYLFSHLWTISFEGQFYTIIPWLVKKIGVNKISAKKVLFNLFVFGTIIRSALIFIQAKHPIIYMSPITHFESILCGVAIGLGFFKIIQNKTQAFVLFSIGVTLNMLVFLLPNTYEIGWKLMLSYPLAGIGSAFIIYSLISESTKNIFASFFNLKPFVYLGKISFGLYIFHIIAITFADAIFKNTATADGIVFYVITVFSLGFLITVIFSSISFRLLEKPFLTQKQKFKMTNSNLI